MTHCVSQVAATIIQKIQHPCDFREAGCDQRCDISAIADHEESCRCESFILMKYFQSYEIFSQVPAGPLPPLGL